jgi:transcriptional regulator with XRE-family HTH domain
MNQQTVMSIAENIKFLRKQLRYTQEQFAEQVGIKRSLVGAYEESRAEPRLQTLSKIAEVFGVTVDNLIKHDFSTGKSPSYAGERVKVLSITVDEHDRENIELVPQKAAAGYLNGFSDPEYIAELPKFRLPVLPDNATYRAFEINGDSMLPLTSGTIVIGKYVDSAIDIRNGKTYVLITKKEGIVYKRVFNYLSEKGKLYLVSDNKQYSAYEIDPNEVEEVWEAKAYISIHFPDPTDQSNDITLEKLTGIVLNIRDDVDQLKKDSQNNS